MTTGDRIKAARKAAGVTQLELAKRIGVTESYISMYERNKRNPKLETLRKIALALGVDLDELIPEKPGFLGIRLTSDLDVYREYIGTLSDLSKIDPLRERMHYAFDQLNKRGQEEAVKRVEELAELPRYQRKAEESKTAPGDPEAE